MALLMSNQIMLIDGPGQALLQITHRRQDGDFYYPSWSPDGKRMAVSQSDHIWILTFD